MSKNKPIEEADLLGHHKNVDFHFLGPDTDENLPGTVIHRRNDMVIKIPGGFGPYSIVGELKGNVYAGENSDDDRRYDVEAKWADLGGIYVGEWLEGGYQYLFSFVLPRKR
jgi:hypothetical protein